MTKRESKNILPAVTQADIHEARMNALESGDFLEDWMWIFDTNPDLALEIRDLAHTEAAFCRVNGPMSEAQAVRLIHFASHIVAIIRHASVREQAEHIRRTVEMRFSDSDNSGIPDDSHE